MKDLRIRHACLVFLALVTAPVAKAEELLTFTNDEFGFTFQYPATWRISPPASSNSRAKVVSPAGTPHAECAVIVQRYPQLDSASQEDIDGVFSEPPLAAEISNSLSQSFNDVRVVALSVGALGARPAQSSRVRYSAGAPANRNYVSGRVVSTATPGLTWTVTCGGQSASPAEAERSYQFWQLEISLLVSSFKFK